MTIPVSIPTAAGGVRISLAQCNPTVGAIEANRDLVLACTAAARARGADLIVFPELTLTGYPPEDLLLRPSLHRRVGAAVERIQAASRGIQVLLGLPEATPEGLYNSAWWLADGQVRARYRKQLLPNYSVFDEKRYFRAGREPCVVTLKGLPVGVTICEDIWEPEPAAQAAAAGARLLVNLNASPFHRRKSEERIAALTQRARETGLGCLYVNCVGGQDELVFDGESLAMGPDGALAWRGPALVCGQFELSVASDGSLRPLSPSARPRGAEPLVYGALVLGVRDYVRKNHFPGAVLGLSGGIDSALTLAIACDALGAPRVEAVLMPSPFTAPMSLEDAQLQASRLGVQHQIIPIEGPMQALEAALQVRFQGLPRDVTEENLQARIRGVLLMAISNKTGRILLTTGNKSEMAVGYATLYGDMAGGFAPLKDVPKTWVYRLARYRNSLAAAVIPTRVLERPPTAELAPNQRDDDLLPPYALLDPILEQYVEEDHGIEELVAAGFPAEVVARVVAMVDRSEYKRRQAPPGVRITRRAFGRDRRYPITSGFGAQRAR